MITTERRRGIALVCVILTLAVVLVYWQAASFQFINCDDDLYVQNNHMVHNGLTWEGVRYAFTTSLNGNWMPMVWLSYMIDRDFTGSSGPEPYHTTNIVLHLANTLLLFLLLHGVTGCRWRSGFVALLFAIHPLHVESVAWIAERKDTLSTLFWMLTMLAYVAYVRRPNARRYALMLGAFVLGIMSKPMLVSLPIVLLLVDIWPLRREKPLRYLILEKSPMLAISAGASILAILMQKQAHALTTLREFPLSVRLCNSAVSCAVYIRKMFWPNDLGWQYAHPGGSLPMWQIVLSVALLVFMTAAAILSARRRPYVTAGWLWYLVTLLPVIGLVQVGHQAMADRYTYVPMIGLFVIAVWGAYELAERLHIASALRVSAGAVAVALVIVASFQVGYWQDSVSLYERSIAINPANSEAHLNLGLALLERSPDKDSDNAIQHLQTALKLDCSLVAAEYGLGTALMSKRDYDQAATHLERAVRLDQKLGTAANDPEHMGRAENNLGVLLAHKGKLREALPHFESAIKACPDNEEIRKNLDFVKTHLATADAQCSAAASAE